MASALQRLFKKRRANAKGKAPVASSSSSSSSFGFSSFQHHPIDSSLGSGSVDTQQPTPTLTVSSLNSSDGRPSSALYAQSTFASTGALDEQLRSLSLGGSSVDAGAADALGRRRARAHSVDALGGYTWAGISAPAAATVASRRSSSSKDWAEPSSLPPVIDNAVMDASQADVDIDESPIFVHLSQSPHLSKEWEETRLVLVPSPAWVESIPAGLLEDDAYVALHAFSPSRMFQDRFVGVRSGAAGQGDRSVSPMGTTDGATSTSSPASAITLVVNIDALAGTVHISASVHGRPVSERTLAVVGEMSFYRTTSARSRRYSSSQPVPSPSPSSAGFEVTSRSRQEKVRVRCLCIEGLVVPDEALRGTTTEPNVDGASSHSLSAAQDRRRSTSSSRDPSPHSIAFPTAAPPSSATFHVHSATDDATMVDASQPAPPRRPSSEEAGVKEGIPAQRNCFVDLALILHPPPTLDSLRPPLQAAFSAIRHASAELTTSYVLVKGFEMYNVGRVRRGVIAKAWLAFEGARGSEASSPLRLDADARTRLLLLLENVAMAHCHSKLFGGVLDGSREADEELAETLEAYSSARVGMLELDIRVPAFRHRPERLRKAIARLEKMRNAEQDLDALLYPLDVEGIVARASEVRAEWDQDAGAVAWPSAGVGDGLASSTSTMTPLDTLETLRSTIEEVGRAADHWQTSSSSRLSLHSMESSHPALTPLGADELLPVLAYIVVKARPRCLASLLAYARTFGLSNVTSPEINWALTTFEAVVDYLRRDPLGIARGSRNDNPLSRTTSLSSTSSHGRSMSPPPVRNVGPSASCSPRSVRPALLPNATHHGGTPLWQSSSSCVSSSSSLRRARRVSLPATGYATSEPPGLQLLSSDRRRSSIVSDEGGSATDASPTLSQDGFKVPALPSSGSGSGTPSIVAPANPRRTSRSSALSRPRSILGSLEEGSSGDAHLSSSQVMQRTGSGSTGSENQQQQQQQLHIRPQIVVRTRKNTSSSVSAFDQAQALTRSGGTASPPSLSSSPPVRVVGRPQAVASSSAMGRTNSDHGAPAGGRTSAFTRRTSMDSWSALSLLGRGGAGDGSAKPSSPVTAPLSLAGGGGGGGGSSWLGSFTPSEWGGASSSSSTMLGGHHKRTTSSSSRPASINSVEGVARSTTLNTLPRSNSGHVGDTTAYSDSASTAGVFPMSSSIGSLPEAASASAGVPLPATTAAAPSSTRGSIGGGAKRKRTRLLSTSSPAAPQLTPASELAPAAFSKVPPSEAQSHLGEALQAVINAPRSEAPPGSSLVGAGVSASSAPSSAPTGPALGLGLGLLHPHHTAADDGYFPPAIDGAGANVGAPALRVVVPSPVDESADPMTARAGAAPGDE